MPIEQVDGGYRWGSHGKVYPDRAEAEKQAAAAHANGWTGDGAAAKRAAVSSRIAEEINKGRDPEQAAAIAYAEMGQDMDPEDWRGLIHGLLKFFTEEAQEPEHAQDALAFDRSTTVRTFDDVGRLHIASAHISKACVNGYYGWEIPGWQELGLESGKTYQMLRDPVELAKAASTFNGIQVLIKHIGVTAEAPQKDVIAGTTGTDTVFSAPYLDTELVIWVKEAIDTIESGEQQELSCGYAYKPVMEPGVFNGENYDGRMTEIKGNHVALVKKGRAGPDVVVGDEAITPPVNEVFTMTKIVLSRTAARVQGALTAYLAPKLALDAKIDLTPVLKDVTAKNFTEKKASIWGATKTAIAGKFALDDAGQMMGAGPDDVAMRILDMIDGQTKAPGEAEADIPAEEGVETDADPAAGGAAAGAGMAAKVMEFLKDKLSPEDCAAIGQMIGGSGGEDEEEDPDMSVDRKDEMPKNMVTKEAMDQAIASAKTSLMAAQRGIVKAREDVRPYVGELALDHDSAESVYRKALTMLKVPGAADMHPDALLPVLQAQAKPGAKRVDTPAQAHDAASVSDFAKRFPHASTIKIS